MFSTSKSLYKSMVFRTPISSTLKFGNALIVLIGPAGEHTKERVKGRRSKSRKKQTLNDMDIRLGVVREGH